MAQTEDYSYNIPGCITDYLRDELGYNLPSSAMQPYIQQWYNTWRSNGEFWDYSAYDSDSNYYEVHRMTVRPAKRVCDEWSALLLNDDTQWVTEDDACSDYVSDFFAKVNFKSRGQKVVAKAFALGTAGWSIEYRANKKDMLLRRYDARMIVPLSWDEDGIYECAFCTKANYGGKSLDQVVMHVLDESGIYHIKTAYFHDGKRFFVEDVEEDFSTLGSVPWFALFSPAIENSYVDFSPYGQAVFADYEDVIHSVDLSYDAIFGEIGLGKMRVFMSDSLFQVGSANNRKVAIPFGKEDATVFRRIDSVDDTIQEFAPALRTEAQIAAYRAAVQKLGDSCGFGSQYFDIDASGAIKTAYQVSTDNQTLRRNIKLHENLLQFSIASIIHAVLYCARTFLGEPLPEEGQVRIDFDDAIITDEATEKTQDMAEVSLGVMNQWEYRAKWYGEDEETAKMMVPSHVSEAQQMFEE